MSWDYLKDQYISKASIKYSGPEVKQNLFFSEEEGRGRKSQSHQQKHQDW